jgi:hypothetical protein
MTVYPLAQTVGQKPYTSTTKNAHGNDVVNYGAVITRPVYGYGPPTRTSDAEPGGTQVIDGLDVFAPVFPVDPRDLFVVDGIEYTVDGHADDWTKGPFGFSPGQVIHLKRVEGGR